MAIYLDSAVLSDAEQAAQLGFVAGVTMNPTLVTKAMPANAGRVTDYRHLLTEILSLIPGKVFIQVTREAAEDMVDEALALVRLAPERIVVKIPCHPEGFGAVRRLRAQGVATLLTAVFTPTQAHIAAQLEADYIAPYVGRFLGYQGTAAAQQTAGSPEEAFIRSLKQAMASSEKPPRILAASVKTVDAVAACLAGGADDVTLPLSVLEQLWQHPLTQQAITAFAADAAAGRWNVRTGE